MAVDPIHQFQIRELFPIAQIGNTEIAFTNSAAYMVAAVAVITLFLIGGTAKQKPGTGPAAINGGTDVRVCRQYHKKHGRQRRHALLPLRVHAFHVHSF